MSPQTRHKAGWPARSPRPFPGTPRLASCCETATRHMVRPSAIASTRWPSRKSSQRRDRRGRTPMSSALSSSMNVICAVCCRRISSIATEAARISRSTRIAPSLGLYSRPLQVSLLHSHSSAVCTIATNVALPELLPATSPAQPFRRGQLSRPTVALRGSRGAPNHCMVPDRSSGERSVRIIENLLPKSSSKNQLLGRMEFCANTGGHPHLRRWVPMMSDAFDVG